MSLTNLTDLSGTPRNCLQTFSMLAPSSVTLLWMIEWTLNINQSHLELFPDINTYNNLHIT